MTSLDIVTAIWAADPGVLTKIGLLKKSLVNKREVMKIGATWALIVYDDDGTTPIISKPLKDFSGADIASLASGVLAAEGASSV